MFHQPDGLPWKSILETFGAHLAQKGLDIAVTRDLLGHHSVTLTEKYNAQLAPSSLASAVQRLDKKENLLAKLVPKGISHHFRTPKTVKAKYR